MPHRTSRRMPISCEPCRSRKIRCTRTDNSNGACASCVRRGLSPSQCVYLRYSYEGIRHAPANDNAGSNEELLDRIRALEDLVRGRNSEEETGGTIVFQGNPTPISPDTQADFSSSVAPSSEQTPPPAGVLRFFSGGYQRYEPHGSQWSSILDPSRAPIAIHGLEASDSNSIGDYPFDLGAGVSVEDLIAQLPPQKQCDELKNVFLNVFAPLFHILHNPTFETQYAQFRHDPASASLSWLALLYAVLSIAVTALDESTNLLFDLARKQSTSQSIAFLSSRYRRLAMQCLQADQFLWRQTICTLQGLVLLIYGINHTHGRTWALLGTTYNIAIALGCNVDPVAFPLTLVEQEERRRCWACVIMLFTIQNTSMGYFGQQLISHNVKLPMDVNDDDLSLESPQSSSMHLPTQMSYILHKFRLYDLCVKVCKEVFGTSRPSYNSVLRLEQDILREQAGWESRYALDRQSCDLPSHHRVHLNILYSYSHQLLLLLHRPSIIRTFENCEVGPGEIENSKRRCIESAQSILRIHESLFKSTEFASFRWYNEGLGSFHAFHACVVLFALLTGMDDAIQYFELKQILKRSLSIFTVMSERSHVCAKAVLVLQYLLSTTGELPPSQSQFGRVESDQSISAKVMARTLEPYQWLSPSNLAWDDWNAFLGVADN